MKFRIRRLEKHEQDYEFLFGVLFFPLLAIAAWLAVSPLANFMPHCYFHQSTGVPCPACGSFRCAENLLKGHWAEALQLQPLAFVLTMAILAFVLYSWIVAIFRLPRIRLDGITRQQRRIAALLLVVAVLANWAYLVCRG